MLASQRRADHPRPRRGVRRRARLRPRRPARRLRHDRPPRHRAARTRGPASSRCTAAPLAVGGRSTDEPGFAAKSALHDAEKQAIAARRGRARRARAPRSASRPAPPPTRSPARLRGVPDLTVVTNSIPVAAAAARVRRAPTRRWCSPAGVRTPPTPWSARSPSPRCARCTSTGCSSACTASTRAPASPRPTWWRPRPTGP